MHYDQAYCVGIFVAPSTLFIYDEKSDSDSPTVMTSDRLAGGV